MRSCLSGLISKFSGFCRTCLSCCGAPRRDSVLPQRHHASEAISREASAEIVFVSTVPTFGIISADSNLTISLNEKMRVSLKIDQGTQTERPETKTQATQMEETQEDPDPKTSKNQIVEKLLNVERPELTLEQEPEQEQENECLQGSSNHSTPIHQADDSASEEQDINSPPCKSEGYEVLSPLLSQQHSTLEGLQGSSNRFTPIHQADDSASEEQYTNSSPNWKSGEFKMLSPLLSQKHSTSIGLQDFSDSKTPIPQVDDSALENKKNFTSNKSQSSTDSLTQRIETNISHFPKDDKTMEQTLFLLQNASTDAVNGVSNFSSLMDSITQDLKQIIEDPLYSSKSISLVLHAKSSLPSSSPSPSSSHIAPKVLAVTVLGNENQLIIC
jgi:hypothetical protein